MKKHSLTLLTTLCLFSFIEYKHSTSLTTLTGKLNNKVHSFQFGVLKHVNNNEKSIEFYDTTSHENACEPINFNKAAILINIPEISIKKYAIDDNQLNSILLFTRDQRGNAIPKKCNSGTVEITAISDTLVSGHINAVIDSANYVNGNFSIPICE